MGTKTRKRPAGRREGAGSNGADRTDDATTRIGGAAVRNARIRNEAAALLHRVPIRQIEALLPILEKYAAPDGDEGIVQRLDERGYMHPMVWSRLRAAAEGPPRYLDFKDVVGAFDLCDTLIHDQNAHDVASCCCADLATLIWNAGSAEDQVEALLVLVPIAARVFNRCESDVCKPHDNA